MFLSTMHKHATMYIVYCNIMPLGVVKAPNIIKCVVLTKIGICFMRNTFIYNFTLLDKSMPWVGTSKHLSSLDATYGSYWLSHFLCRHIENDRACSHNHCLEAAMLIMHVFLQLC